MKTKTPLLLILKLFNPHPKMNKILPLKTINNWG